VLTLVTLLIKRCLKLRHDQLLSHPFQFMIYISSCNSMTAHPAADSTPSCWEHTQLLTAHPATDNTASCWRHTQLPTAHPAVDRTPSCWRLFKYAINKCTSKALKSTRSLLQNQLASDSPYSVMNWFTVRLKSSELRQRPECWKFIDVSEESLPQLSPQSTFIP
jgi:hypothetical protein